MNKFNLEEKLNNINGIVAISVFGSYGTDLWIEGRSDIDVAVIVKPSRTFQDTLNM
ncbi:MAG: nucleotidyltransferase domain-containing protein [Clostridium sp.]